MKKTNFKKNVMSISERKQLFLSYQNKYKVLFPVTAILNDGHVFRFENILISDKGVILIHCFNYEGEVEGSNNSEKWTLYKPESNGIYEMIINNPINFLEFQAKNLESFLKQGGFDCPIYRFLYIPNIHNQKQGIIMNEADLKRQTSECGTENELSETLITNILDSFYSYSIFENNDLRKVTIKERENTIISSDINYYKKVLTPILGDFFLLNNITLDNNGHKTTIRTLIISLYGIFTIRYLRARELMLGEKTARQWINYKVKIKSLEENLTLSNPLTAFYIQKNIIKKTLKKMNIHCRITGCIYMPFAFVNFQDKHFVYTQDDFLKKITSFTLNKEEKLSELELQEVVDYFKDLQVNNCVKC